MWAHSKHEDGGKDADARALTMHEDTPSSPLAALVLPQPLCQSRSKLSNMPERVLQVFTAQFSCFTRASVPILRAVSDTLQHARERVLQGFYSFTTQFTWFVFQGTPDCVPNFSTQFSGFTSTKEQILTPEELFFSPTDTQQCAS